jgi:hypothetical protein
MTNISGKFQNALRLGSMLLNKTWFKEEIWREFLKYFKLNENENTIYQIL